MIASADGISRVHFEAGENKDPTQLERQAQREIEEYFAGERKEFSVKVCQPQGDGFYARVQRELASISYGEVLTYGELAARLGSPGASRAVGTACARNPVPILVPCHRVVAKNGLGGFLGGLSAKQHLLELERIHWQP